MCKIEVNINYGAYHAHRINEYVFFSGEEHTCNTADGSNILQQSSINNTCNKLMIDFLYTHKAVKIIQASIKLYAVLI